MIHDIDQTKILMKIISLCPCSRVDLEHPILLVALPMQRPIPEEFQLRAVSTVFLHGVLCACDGTCAGVPPPVGWPLTGRGIL